MQPKTDRESCNVVRVAIPAPLRGYFDYLNPESLCAPLPGARVRVAFGRRQVVGVVTEVGVESALDKKRLRPLTETLDTQTLLGSDLRNLAGWLADYYQHPIGETYAAMLPALLRRGEPAARSQTRVWRLTAKGREIQDEDFKSAHRQRQVWALLGQSDQGLADAELKAVKAVGPTLKNLHAKGLVEFKRVPSSPNPAVAQTVTAPELNDEQAQAVAVLSATSGFTTSLIEGVTGSGKTEIYLALAEQVLAQGKQVLVLVPEIGLTPQLVERFSTRLCSQLAVLHSGLNDRERLNAWLAARDGDAGVILGTRSAVLTPLARPGLIVVDEEHDPSYKQQDGLRYSARDVAVRRAQMLDIPIVLGTATPSLESLHNAVQGRYRHLRLHARAGGASKPKMQLLDVRARPLIEGLSEALLTRVQSHLDAGGQVLLFLNRRGYAPALVCHDCGWVAPCPRCDTGMTLHRGGRKLCCHHCGGQRPPPLVCGNCGGKQLVAVGEGTERIAGALRAQFPGVPMARFDRDSVSRKGSFERQLAQVQSGELRLLVGTQMLAKGHDFPDLTLVGVVNADHGLFAADFRAFERMAQLVTQVAGRAGRGARAGEVLLQTRHPEHPLLNLLVGGGYHPFARAALAERESGGLPPYGFLALLRAESPQSASPPAFLDAAAQAAREFNMPEVELWGPVPAPMERRAGRVRGQLLLRAEKRSDLHRLLRVWIPVLERLPLARRVRWSVDVDPQDLI